MSDTGDMIGSPAALATLVRAARLRQGLTRDTLANGRRVGTLFDTNGNWSFAYEEDWVNMDGAYPISPKIPLTVETPIDGYESSPHASLAYLY